ncbi:hypothetical protein KY290_028366 [Solanum tuberosum]|uniref:Uncharacterized protein n=1 Tax=Solanum tuberosum TaxID=4113 RepID=A0ABQ7UI40_SOLTU|nr:hypothetical protein KY290_028366 [Solanum tuberosum]
MATGSETHPSKGNVTLESIIEAFADMSWKMGNIKERMASVEGRLSGMEERVNIPSNRVPQSQPNPVVYPSLCKDFYVGTNVMNEGTRVPNKEPTIKGVMDALMGCPRSDSMSISFVENSIACFAHRDHALENASKNDMCLFEDELACFNSSLVFYHSLFKYNILFIDDEITPSDVSSGVNNERSIVLDSYTCYSNPLWCEVFPPKGGNLFLEDESTHVGKECDEEECRVCFPIIFSSWCVTIVNGMTHEFESINSHTHENTLEEFELRDTFLYYLFTYDDAHDVEWSMMLGDESANRAKEEVLDPSPWISYPFDPGVSYKSFVDICDAWLYVKFVHPWHGGEFVVSNATPHAMRIFVLFASPMILHGMDSRTNHFQEKENDAIQIASRLSIHELQCFDRVFTRMEVVEHVWMPMRGFHALHENIYTLKELPVGQHHA